MKDQSSTSRADRMPVESGSLIKTGIWKLEQLRSGRDRTALTGSLKQISITLYGQVHAETEAERLAERILLTFGDERGSFKRTYERRFEAFDAAVADQIQKHFDASAQVRVHDLGVSDARTSCDFFERLRSLRTGLSLLATDLAPELEVIRFGRTRLVIGPDGQLLEITWPPFVFNQSKPDSLRHHPINRVIRTALHRLLVPRILEAHRRGEIQPERLSLWCPRAVALSRSDDRFRLGRYDVISRPIGGGYAVVRAMNVLNPAWFSEKDMKTALRNVLSSLEDGGLLVLGSNEGPSSPVDGGIYRKTKGRIERLVRSGKGPLVEPMSLGCD
jgi:hypothetical protein